MRIFRIVISLFFVIGLFGHCSTQTKWSFEDWLKSQDGIIKDVVDNADKHNLQIKLTKITRTNEEVEFEDYEFNVNDQRYFYPASTVKFPAVYHREIK